MGQVNFFFFNVKKRCSSDTNFLKEAKKIWDLGYWLGEVQ